MAGFVIPVRRIEGVIDTGVAIRNTDLKSASLKLTLRNTLGAPVASGTTTIADFPALGHVAKFIDQLFTTADTSNFTGTMTVEASSGKVTATGLELGSRAGQFTTLPVTPLN